MMMMMVHVGMVALDHLLLCVVGNNHGAGERGLVHGVTHEVVLFPINAGCCCCSRSKREPPVLRVYVRCWRVRTDEQEAVDRPLSHTQPQALVLQKRNSLLFVCVCVPLSLTHTHTHTPAEVAVCTVEGCWLTRSCVVSRSLLATAVSFFGCLSFIFPSKSRNGGCATSR
jgi:hypothetical protein